MSTWEAIETFIVWMTIGAFWTAYARFMKERRSGR